jgi:hypothetical protein
VQNELYWFPGTGGYMRASADSTVPDDVKEKPSWTGVGIPSNELVWVDWPAVLDPWGAYWLYAFVDCTLLIDPMPPTKGAIPPPLAPAAKVPYNWSIKLRAETAGRSDTTKFAGVVADAADGLDKYDAMELPSIPGSTTRLSFVHEDGDYSRDMKAPANEMSWLFKVDSAGSTPVAIRFDNSAVPAEYRTIMLVDTETDARINLRDDAESYVYKPSGSERIFKLIISKAHFEAYAAIPEKFELLQNYPNPFNPETWIPFKLAKTGDVSIKIYNIAGQLVRTLELGHKEAGSYTVKERTAYWDGKNDFGETVAGGVYFYHIKSGSFHATRKMVILK